MDFEKLFIGAFGAAIGVIGWLFVGLYIQRRAKTRGAGSARGRLLRARREPPQRLHGARPMGRSAR
jgi:hypothetical protein